MRGIKSQKLLHKPATQSGSEDLTLDKLILQEAARGNFWGPRADGAVSTISGQ